MINGKLGNWRLSGVTCSFGGCEEAEKIEFRSSEGVPMHSKGPIRQTGPIDLRDDAHAEKRPLRELGMLKGRFAIQVPNPVPETKSRLA
jgi:hypothetical protein